MPLMDNIKAKIVVGSLVLSAAGVAFIQQQEGTKLNEYKDSVGIPTICTGHIKGVYPGQKATLAQCEQWLKEDASVAGKGVKRLVKVPITQAQYDSLVSFTFNLGEGSLAKSNLLKKINANECVTAGAEFLKWDKARVNGKLVPLKGLTKRRQAESAMWLTGC